VKRFDERDTMFSRLGLVRGTKKYRDYYNSKPDYQKEDDRVRESTHKTMARIFSIDAEQMKQKPQRIAAIMKITNIFLNLSGKKMGMNPDRMLKMGAANNEESIVSSAMVRPAARMANLINIAACKQKVSRHKVKIDPAEMSLIIKELALSYGGDIVGIAEMKSHHYYSHRGDVFGMGGGYGKQIHPSYKYAIVVAVALNRNMVNKAPGKEVQIASMLGYALSSAVTAQLALYIKSLGHEAQTDNFLEYYSPISPLAVAAGIGQMGRCNMVVNPRYGNRLKIGAVLTNLPLVADGSVDFGLVEFCHACGKCARNCPAGAISKDKAQMINGMWQWEHNETKCMEMWMKTGTGICMSCCPFSQGVEAELIGKMKGNKKVIEEIISLDAAKQV
jgi:epoxyqueuosine reductase QueG